MSQSQGSRTTTDEVFRLDGERALITGGGTGLGRAIAAAMAQAGASVVITGRREQPLREAAAEIGERATYIVHDVTDLKRAQQLIDAASDRAGGMPTILVNNAGIHLKKWATETSDDEFRSVLDTHVNGAFALTRALAPSMIQAKHGGILFVASMASLFGIPQVIAYTAAKSALTGMVRALATELSPHNVRVNAIAPGWIDSPMLRKAFEGDPQRGRKILSRTPMGKFGEAADVAYAAVYLSSPAAKFVTGTTLVVDGGASIGF